MLRKRNKTLLTVYEVGIGTPIESFWMDINFKLTSWHFLSPAVLFKLPVMIWRWERISILNQCFSLRKYSGNQIEIIQIILGMHIPFVKINYFL